MVRSFLTRLANSVTRTVLLIPCLLICLACATPFPLENLEKGMTMERATEAFGEPSSTKMGELHQAVQLLQKEIARIYVRLASAVDLSETRSPVARKLEELGTRTLRSLERFVAELDEANGEQGVRSTWVYPHEEVDGNLVLPSILLLGLPLIDGGHIQKHEVELLFEGNKLVSWETRRLPSVPTSGTYGYYNPFPTTMFPHSSKDTQHHQRGHEHHH